MVNESTPFGWQAARKRYSAVATGVKGLRRLPALGLLSLAIALAQAAPVHAQNIGETRDYTISSQPLGAALNQLALAADRQIMVPPELVRGRTAPALAGHYSLDAALRQLLAGSGLTYEITGTGTVMVKQTPPDPPHRSAKPVPAATQKADQKPEPTTLQSVTVTGTRIRGGSTPSPVITIGSEQMQEEGFSDLGEVIRSIPQNFSGGQNPGVSSAGFSEAGLANKNVTGGSSLNLRGLGPDASLTLLNGHRMAYSGFVQAVDISAIPVEAVDRIEIVPDGASAIYGADAVGGVGNVILKRDFEGATIGARYGGATEGGLATREYTATAGTYWNSGGFIATYKDVSVDPVYAADRNYTEYLGPPTTIYPGSKLKSGLLSAHQSLGNNVELSLDALRSERDQNYYWDSNIGISHLWDTATTTLISPTVEWSLPHDWTLSLGGTWGRDEQDQHQVNNDPTTNVSTVMVNDCYCNESRTYELSGEGPLFELSSGDVRLAAGAGYRKNAFWQYSYTKGARTTQGVESARFAYAEINVPVIGAGQSVPGVRLLALTAAVRREDYSSFGGVTTPKIGLIYSPNNDFTAKASWGRSFKAPTLLQVNQGQVAQLGFPGSFGGTGYPDEAMAVRVGGGNPNLKPERARTWTASLAYHPEALPGLEMELTGFHIDYTDRVVQPIINDSQVLGNPFFAQVIDYQPSAAEVERIVSTTKFYNFTGVPYDPDNVVAVIHENYVNVARQKIKGADLSGTYRFDLGPGRFTVRGSATWMDSAQRSTAAQDFFNLSGTLFNPAKVTSRIGAVWNQGGFSASVFGNYKGGVTNTVDGKKTASFTTFDVALRYANDQPAGVLSGVAVTLSIQNLLDRAPPLYTPSSYADYTFPYDSTNYSAIGRFISLSLSKHFGGQP
jgi:outer membrane receptor protein involved in Fe transport